MTRIGELLKRLGEESGGHFIQKGSFAPKLLKDHGKSVAAERSWNQHYYQHLRGIKKFHDSPEGKLLHKKIGRFLMLKRQAPKTDLAKAQDDKEKEKRDKDGRTLLLDWSE